MAEQAGAQFHVNSAGGVAEDVGAHAIEHTLKHHDHHQADDEHVKRGHAFVNQHFVHHDLKEQRADQGKQLQHEADEQHLAKQLAVFDQAGDEPGKVELGQLACQCGVAGDEDELARPLAGKNIHRLDGGATTWNAGVLQQDTLAVGLREDYGADAAISTAYLRQCGEWREHQAVSCGVAKLCFETEVLGSAQQVLCGDLCRWCQAKLMRQIGGVSRYLMKAGNGAKGGKCFKARARRIAAAIL